MKGVITIYICPLCKNTDEKYFGYKNGEIYCRRCISFKGEVVDEESNVFDGNLERFRIDISYKLSEEQESFSRQILTSFINHKDTLVYAVCGAGKTELVFETISYALKNKLKVGFAIPRKDVVIELRERLKASFKEANVIAVYGDHHNDLAGDIIVLTTHQLYRYEKYFDLLILDEIDAFPYRDNPVLEALFIRSLKGNYVMMSATPSDNRLEDFKQENKEILYLFHRYHRHPLPVPKIKIYPYFLKYIYLLFLIKKYKSEKKMIIIFCPTINDSEYIYNFCRLFYKNGNYVHSKREERNEIINEFREFKYDYLVSTSVLERGVTIPNLQVIIFCAHHDLYSKEALIQISGRAGRSIKYPEGEVIYIGDKITEAMEKSKSTIEGYNKDL